MDTLEAIHTRRTTKQYDREQPVPREQLERILEAARWAPNHRMTEPWRFRVVGPQALERLKELAGEGAAKLETAPVLVVASFVPSPIPMHAEEDEHATAIAAYLVLLAAHAEGLASFWRTPNFLRDEVGKAAVDVPAEERIVGLLYLGHAANGLPDAPERKPLEHYVSWLD